ncbi:MAG TPA: hypothetical protein DD766_03145 [Desulfovibrio sp.]|jgi:hypothetical protein|nr:hypothetical protein [Desulfovibrio sp.]HBR06091.1 hypothetical protein [Desulfovibrio sp.]
MRNILVKRNGGRDMVFTGRMIAKADDSEVSDKRPIYVDCLTLWTLTLYETKDGGYVLSSEYDAYAPQRVSLKDALRFDSPEALLLALERDGHTHAELTRLLLRRAAQTSEAFAPRRERRAPLYPPAMQQESPNQPELLAECA